MKNDSKSKDPMINSFNMGDHKEQVSIVDKSDNSSLNS